MRHRWTVVVLLGLGATALSGCYVVSPYAYPGYAPAYPPPAYAPPPPGGWPAGAPPAPSAASPGPAPTVPGAPQGAARDCQTVTVEGHYETRVRPGGQRETLWVPAHEEQVCQ